MLKVNNINRKQTFTGMGQFVVKNKQDMYYVQSAMVEVAQKNNLLIGTDAIYGLLNKKTGKDMFVFSGQDAIAVKNSAQQYIQKVKDSKHMPNENKILNIKLKKANELTSQIKKTNTVFQVTQENLTKLPEMIEKIIFA